MPPKHRQKIRSRLDKINTAVRGNTPSATAHKNRQQKLQRQKKINQHVAQKKKQQEAQRKKKRQQKIKAEKKKQEQELKKTKEKQNKFIQNVRAKTQRGSDMKFPPESTVLPGSEAPSINLNWCKRNHIHSYCASAYIISIRYPRYLQCHKRLGHWNVKRFQSVDGRLLDKQQLIREGVTRSGECFTEEKRKRSLTEGEYGCFLSHLNLWKWAVENHIPYLFVIEDDWMLNVKNHQQVNHLYKACCELEKELDWDLVYLYAGNNTTRKFAVGAIPVSKYWQKVNHPPQTSGYIIKYETMKKFIEHAYPITCPVDIYMHRQTRLHQLNWYLTKKNVAGVAGFESDTWLIRKDVK